jgi:hypothetical protein
VHEAEYMAKAAIGFSHGIPAYLETKWEKTLSDGNAIYTKTRLGNAQFQYNCQWQRKWQPGNLATSASCLTSDDLTHAEVENLQHFRDLLEGKI